MRDPVKPHRGFRLAAISYASAHSRVKRLWGSASQYPCIKCGGAARDWAYDHTDPTELHGETARQGYVAYSIHEEFYAPMCGKCHAELDFGPSEQPDDQPVW